MTENISNNNKMRQNERKKTIVHADSPGEIRTHFMIEKTGTQNLLPLLFCIMYTQWGFSNTSFHQT